MLIRIEQCIFARLFRIEKCIFKGLFRIEKCIFKSLLRIEKCIFKEPFRIRGGNNNIYICNYSPVVKDADGEIRHLLFGKPSENLCGLCGFA